MFRAKVDLLIILFLSAFSVLVCFFLHEKYALFLWHFYMSIFALTRLSQNGQKFLKKFLVKGYILVLKYHSHRSYAKFLSNCNGLLCPTCGYGIMKMRMKKSIPFPAGTKAKTFKKSSKNSPESIIDLLHFILNLA